MPTTYLRRRGRRVALRPTEAPLPHERDVSPDMTGGIPSEPVRQAYRDLRRGLQDTDRGAEADRAYRKLKR